MSTRPWIIFGALALACGVIGVAGCSRDEAPEAEPSAAREAAPEAPPEPVAETFGIRNASFAEDGLLTAGQPTAEQLRAAAGAGYRTVIDLRMPAEDRGFDEAQVVADAGMSYVGFPVTGDAIEPGLVERFGQTLDAAERPVLLHCGSANRVGAVYAGLLMERGESLEAAIERAREIGLTSAQLEERVRALPEVPNETPGTP